MNKEYFPFNEGMPTGPDVDLLMKTWASPQVGDEFSYDAIEKLLGVERDSRRFRTITNVWRKRWLEKAVVIECKDASAFYVANPEQISSRTYGVLEQIGRKAKWQRRKIVTIRPKDDAQRLTKEHLARLMLVTEKEAKKNRLKLNILPATEVKAAPRIAPGVVVSSESKSTTQGKE